MKKVFVISNMYPTQHHLSYGIFVKNQVDQLTAQGISVVLGVNTDPNTGKVNVIKKYAKWALGVFATFRRYKQDIGITHSHYVFPSGMFSYLLKKRYGIPYVLTAHGGDINKMAKKSARIRNYTKKILQHADHIIAVGEELASDIVRDFHVEERRVSVMSMGVDRTVFFEPTSKKEQAIALQMDPHKVNFLFVGNIIREKGVEELLKAFIHLDTSLPNKAALYCIGSTKNLVFSHQMKELATQSNNIHFIEPMPQAKLAQYFQAATVFVLPSYIEGLGLVALEAMNCGTPVIASDVGGLHYMLQEGAGVLVPPKNADALYEELKDVVENGRKLEVNTEAVDRLLALHDASSITERLIAIYGQYEKKN